jgi:hypothetical protein
MGPAQWLLAGCAYPLQIQHNEVSVPQPYASVVVDVPIGPVRVTGWSGATTEVGSTVRWHGRPPEIRLEVVEDELRVTVDCPSPVVYCATDLDLRVPARAGVRVRSDSGDVEVGGVGGPVRIHTGTGAILVDHLSGPAVLESAAGAIVGTDLDSPEVDAQTGVGSVVLGFGRAPRRVAADVGAGRIELQVPSGAYDLRTRLWGELDVRGVTSDPRAASVLDLATGVGSIHVRGVPAPDDLPLAIPADGT